MINFIYKCPSKYRKIILIIVDYLSIIISFFLTDWLVFDKNYAYESKAISAICIACLYSSVYIFTGQYKSLIRYFGSNQIYKLLIWNFVLSSLVFSSDLILNLTFLKVRFIIIFTLILSGLIGFIKIYLRDIILIIQQQHKSLKRIIIYGAGDAGVQLASAVKLEKKCKIIAFVDDNKDIQGKLIFNIPVISNAKLVKIKNEIDFVILAIPSINNKNKRRIIKFLKTERFKVFQIPSILELTNNNSNINTLKPILIDDVLGRDRIRPIKELLFPAVKDKNILITGAGGSIGSELSRQILKLSPKKLILLERNEPSLYKINQELSSYETNVDLLLILGSCTNRPLLTNIFNRHEIDIVFHAAAYKHVPLVESNFIQAVFNNVFSTKYICEEAERHDIEKLIFISTDKAVRPSNVMGASKRISEQIVQAFERIAKNNKKETKFSMVRFGNVLGSSGSVVPLFKKQILNGGPITITHENINRFFMTSSEAVELVIQSVMLAEGGDVFLLDMGEPIKIKHLAEQMITLSGLTIKDAKNPDGDIGIICTGLRPGEKLYEELLICKESINTKHPLIFRAKEKFLSSQKLFSLLDELDNNLNEFKHKKVIENIQKIVPEWTPSEFINNSR